VKEKLVDIFAFLLASKYSFDVKEIILEKIKMNAEKYPIEKAKSNDTTCDVLSYFITRVNIYTTHVR